MIHLNKKFIFLICGILFLSALTSNAAELPPDPNNAALLYYQVLLIKRDPNIAISRLIRDVLHGAELNDSVRAYLKSCDETIKLIDTATQIPQCNWGVLYSQGYGLSMVIIGHLRQLQYLLCVYARALASDGDYREAIDWGLNIHQIAGHIGDDTIIMREVSLNFEQGGLTSIQYVLESMPPNFEILTWLKSQLAVIKGVPHSPARAMENDRDLAIQRMRNNPSSLKVWKLQLSILAGLPINEKDTNGLPQNMIPNSEEIQKFREMLSLTDQEIKEKLGMGMTEQDVQEMREMMSIIDQKKTEIQELLNLTDEELIDHARQSYNAWFNSVIQIINGDLSYQKKITALRNIQEQENKSPFNFIGIQSMVYTDVLQLYNQQVQYTTYLNAIRAAIEVYSVKTETGELPQVLPGGLPKDPYSGKDFEYEIKEDGFILRCRIKPVDERQVRKYEFKVQK